MVNKDEISALFDAWNSALQTRDPKKVAALYESNAILLPTVSNKVRHNHEEIEDYFVAFLAKEPVGKIDEANIRSFGDVAINSGVYTFTFGDGAKVQARFTYVYRWNGQQWKIVEHHSSQMPEG
ncbi:SgcJ/EcaC family oxidoreductase [Agaribacterium haliotis]|uniref:SgcJ/EcaC family oxidoreductase n=1 Tax=Agaribacterium haliotis TaxID=2013869 RepID=UPI000BB59336|nr:SgcJ/EcaC family oxidoreductase [Agaribacterium haliotis]